MIGSRTTRSTAARAALRGLLLAAAAIVLGVEWQTAAIGSQSGNSPPVVTIARPTETQALTWGSAFRYAITVSDTEDGDSASGEIPPHTILLEVEYRGAGNSDPGFGRGDRTAGLDVMRTSNCFTCHADKMSLVGPSFSAIAERYGSDPEALGRLAGRIRNGSTGQWGTVAMPPHDDFSEEQALAAARFIVDQGREPHRWLYAGPEGVIRIIDKPADAESGTYTLTASYLDNGIAGVPDSRRRGEAVVRLVVR